MTENNIIIMLRRLLIDFIRNLPRKILLINVLLLGFVAGYLNLFEIGILDRITKDLSLETNLEYPFIRGVIFSLAFATVFMILRKTSIIPELGKIIEVFFDVAARDSASKRHDDSAVSEIKSRLDDLDARSKGGISKVDYSSLIEEVVTRTSATVDQSLLKTVEDKYGSRMLADQLFQVVDEALSTLLEGLAWERNVVSTRSLFNLLIGSGVAISGIWILYDMLASITYSSADWQVPVLQFVSRLSVVIIIEIFAYFFLNLYRGGLQEIKYFRNEITNVMSQQIALRAAILKKDKTTIASIVLKLADTERNFVLKKGESTVALAQNRLDREQDTQLASIIASAVKDGIKEGNKDN